MKIKKKRAVIIGSLKYEDDILSCRRILDIFGDYDEIRDPITDRYIEKTDPDFNLMEQQRRYVEFIAKTTHVFLIRKPDGTIGEYTSYEMAIADFFGKPVIEWWNPSINLCNGGMIIL